MLPFQWGIYNWGEGPSFQVDIAPGSMQGSIPCGAEGL